MDIKIEAVAFAEWILSQPMLFFEHDHWSNNGIQYTSSELYDEFKKSQTN